MQKFFLCLALYNLHFHFLHGNVLNCQSQGTVIYRPLPPHPLWIPSHWPIKCFRQVLLIRIMLCYSNLARSLPPLLSLLLLLRCYCFRSLVASKAKVGLKETRSQQHHTFLMFMEKELKLKTMFFTSLQTSIFLL